MLHCIQMDKACQEYIAPRLEVDSIQRERAGDEGEDEETTKDGVYAWCVLILLLFD